MDKAILKAYEMLEDNSDPVTAEIKKEHPKMETVEYWWLKKLVDRITFDKEGRFMTVHWLCGQKTEVPTEYYRMASDIRTMQKKKEEVIKETVFKPAVRRIKAKEKKIPSPTVK